ncbi:hypothetical protein [Bradyrhizobium sp. WSM2793]|uniref:hypothetical protein n=1 Tax=Bradyrhizobium sp. WSM2793 TaxID=1038866 RepID=UPI0003A0B992|nr:hypothetical protein [Bradyrhizobium sp. WSM2793]
MRSIAQTFAFSLGIAATTIFLIMVAIFVSRYPMEERESGRAGSWPPFSIAPLLSMGKTWWCAPLPRSRS